MICHDVFLQCTADLVGQLNGDGQKGMLQIDAPPVENFWYRLAAPGDDTLFLPKCVVW